MTIHEKFDSVMNGCHAYLDNEDCIKLLTEL